MGYSDAEMEEYEACDDYNTPGMIRVSFGIYNTEEEVDTFLEILKEQIEEIKEHNRELDEKELWDDIMYPGY